MNKFLHAKKWRYGLIFLIIAISQMSSNAFSAAKSLTESYMQEKKVTINYANVDVKSILDEIYTQTKISFAFESKHHISELPKMTINVRRMSVDRVLNMIFKDTPFDYEIKNDIVVILKKEKSSDTPQEEEVETIMVKGKVIDKKTKKPIIGATVIIEGTTKGAIADSDGNFVLMASTDSQLEISFTGMKTIKYSGIKKNKDILIYMETDVLLVDDFVVTGYGSVNRVDMVGTYTTIKADDIRIEGKTNIADMLQGRVAGMVVTNTSSRVGATPTIQIRGQSTLSSELGNRSPIWVVDGVIQDDPISITGNQAGVDDIKNLIGNQVSWLNPDDIDTITVLKDASATAVYGSRASNGVIVITTKVAVDNKLSINYTGSMTINSSVSAHQFDYMNSQERVQITEELFNSGIPFEQMPIKQYQTFDGVLRMYVDRDITLDEYISRRTEFETMNTDWFNELTRVGVSQSHNLSVSGRVSEKLGVRASIGYNNTIGQEIQNDNANYTSRINLNARINDRLNISFTLSGSKAITNGTATAASHQGGGGTPLTYAKQTSRAIAAYNPDGTHSYYDVYSSYKYNEDALLGYNFINEIEQTGASSTSTRIGASVNANYKIAEYLTYELRGSYSYNTSERQAYRTERSFSIADTYRGYDFNSVTPLSAEYKAALMPFGGTSDYSSPTSNSLSVGNSLRFSKTFNDKHRLNVSFSHEVNSTTADIFSTKMWGYLSDRGGKFAVPPIDITPITGSYGTSSYGLLNGLFNGGNQLYSRTTNMMSFFATVAYSFDNRIVLNANARSDMSNRFGQDVNKRLDPTFSFGMKWNVTQEKFLADRLKWLSHLSISATYGIQGNANLAQSPDLILAMGGVNAVYDEYSSGISQIPNPYLGWEKTTNWDLGANMRLVDRVNVQVNYYWRESNAITAQDIGLENGQAQLQMNGGMIYNSGVEFTLSFNPIQTKDFGLNLSFNSSQNWNRGGATTFDETALQNASIYLNGDDQKIIKEGYPIGAIWAWEFSHLDDEYGSARFKNMDIDPRLAMEDPTLLLTYVGTAKYDFTGGISLGLRYKNFTLNTGISALLGGFSRLPSPYSALEGGSYYNLLPTAEVNMSRDLLKRWKKPGDENTTIYPGIKPGSVDNIIVPGQETALTSIDMWNMSDARIANKSFLRCNTIGISYNLNSRILKEAIGISRMSIRASVSNPFVIGSKDFNGFDPELGNSVMPKTYSISLTIGF